MCGCCSLPRSPFTRATNAPAPTTRPTTLSRSLASGGAGLARNASIGDRAASGSSREHYGRRAVAARVGIHDAIRAPALPVGVAAMARASDRSSPVAAALLGVVRCRQRSRREQISRTDHVTRPPTAIEHVVLLHTAGARTSHSAAASNANSATTAATCGAHVAPRALSAASREPSTRDTAMRAL